jgi:hypothetical protein
MEALETQILQQFGCSDPYLPVDDIQRADLP